MTSRSIRSLLVTASAAILAACATATPYQPASQPGGFDGFTQTMLEADRARISFGGNSLTKRDTVENYMLFRAAETALERGYDWFELVERDVEQKSRVRVSPGAFSAYDPYFGYSVFHPRFGWSRPYRYSRFGGFHRKRGFGFGFNRFHSPFNDPFFNDFNVREITKYRATAEVRFGQGPRPDDRAQAFDARQVIENLGATIKEPDA